jgi:uncharacterized protein
MRRLMLLAACIAFAGSIYAQNIDLRRKISVSGIAETEVTPDIIDVSISLQEYMDGKTRVGIDQLENQLENAVKAAGIAKEDFTVNNVSGSNYSWQRKKDPNFLASKQYGLRVHDLDKFNQIMSQLDPKGVQSTYIANYDYSKMPEVKRDLKIKALEAAKEKATYLLNSIGEKLGRIIEISEEGVNAPVVYNNRAVYANAMVSSNKIAADSDIDFKKIKLSFQVNAVFEIAN